MLNHHTYLKIIAECNFARPRVSNKQIMAFANVSPATVTEMTRQLQKCGLVNRRRYTGVTLTDQGRELATHLLYTYRLCEVFLAQHLHLPLTQIPEQAWQMADTLEPPTVTALATLLDHPQQSPFGGDMTTDLLNDTTVMPLSQLTDHTTTRLIGYLETPSLVAYFQHCQLAINQPLYLLHRDEDLNFICLETTAREEIIVNLSAADYLYVQKKPTD
ncbi:metal-dependent transcriptional regulator [Levilactobacillus brevis]|uniref:metal-dependent transcriptional regulator n=1 Tax=Levilactobacillus brevis TaxID=1580 RepID=UPI000BEAA901|nr:metal-dependent transcriptional regulator [Levilactobacillus brevis]MCM6796640.1 metal-dependent transcriptional regulator [Levilactobacillus brevis]MCZ2118848.1 metal-dependent transcriptional regulator [Levilactobacillus brevis]MCZ2124334.1 metal-dependent transcriptional regulator [Levilactobacillus brevis]MCZ2208594.1 metal-dependent transcriptional regulator [Levilactobacillus brevis]MCZ2324057.1 metal-dependent transcriptional regulator [Levilactobacillus brevis]